VWLWGTFLSATFTYLLFVGPTEVLLPYVVKTELGGSATALRLVLTSGGLGAIAAALAVGWIGIPRRFITYMYTTWASPRWPWPGTARPPRRGSWPRRAWWSTASKRPAVAWATDQARWFPGDMLGRVSSVDWFVSTALLPLSYAAVAPVASWIGVRHTLVGAGILGAVVTFGFLFLPGMRLPEEQAGGRTGPADTVPTASSVWGHRRERAPGATLRCVRRRCGRASERRVCRA
jgi:hypothetical protein